MWVLKVHPPSVYLFNHLDKLKEICLTQSVGGNIDSIRNIHLLLAIIGIYSCKKHLNHIEIKTLSGV